MGTTISKSHQTLGLILVSESDSSNQRARKARLVESVNGAQIKVDVYSVDAATGEIVGAGLVYPEAVVATPPSADQLVEVGRNLGYTQTLVLSN